MGEKMGFRQSAFWFAMSGVVIVAGLGFALAVHMRSQSLGVGTCSSLRFREKTLVGLATRDTSAILAKPTGLAVDLDDHLLFVADSKENCVAVYTPDGVFLRRIGRIGQGPGDLFKPVDVAYAAGKLYVLEAGNWRVSIFRANGEFVRSFRVGVVAEDQKIAVTKDGQRICLNEIDPSEGTSFAYYNNEGDLLSRFAPLYDPPNHAQKFEMNVACFDFDDEGLLYVFYSYRPSVCKFDTLGNLLTESSLNIPEVAEKQHDYQELLKTWPQGVLVTYVSDVSYFAGQFVVSVPPSHRRSNTGGIVYIFDREFQPLQRIEVGRTELEEIGRQGFFSALAAWDRWTFYGVKEHAGALCQLTMGGSG